MKINLTWTKKNHTHPVWPIFIPFAGCKVRCIFCAQELQSGTKLQDISHILTKTEHELKHRQKEQKPAPELGFFGGTFTALSEKDLDMCCDFVHKAKLSGLICSARCSTRPDAINIYILKKLKNAGFESIELGIQSFNNAALDFSKRNYNKAQAEQACNLVKEYGFNLGIQLMPGMPKLTPEIFLEDVKTALACDANFLRYYPCQVIKDTVLASLWANGKYKPWTFEQTVESLSTAWLMAHEKEIPVIRMGLAPEDGLDDAILAGPRHPALGSIVQGEALFLLIKQALKNNKAKSINLPRSCQGFFGGHKNSLLKKWQTLGVNLQDIAWNDSHFIEITY